MSAKQDLRELDIYGEFGPWAGLSEVAQQAWAEIVASRRECEGNGSLPEGLAELCWILDGEAFDIEAEDGAPSSEALRVAHLSRELDLRSPTWRSLLNEHDRITVARVRASL